MHYSAAEQVGVPIPAGKMQARVVSVGCGKVKTGIDISTVKAPAGAAKARASTKAVVKRFMAGPFSELFSSEAFMNRTVQFGNAI
jgi:hypothetical protein